MDTDPAVNVPIETQPARGAGEVEAVVVELRPAATYLVKTDTQAIVLAHAAGNQARNFVRLRPGDKVRVRLAPRDPGRGRILELL